MCIRDRDESNCHEVARWITPFDRQPHHLTDISPFKKNANWEIKGRGGTCFQPVIDHFNEKRGRYTALIYLTDGEAPAPEDCPKNTLWVLSADSNWTDHLPGKTIQLNTH